MKGFFYFHFFIWTLCFLCTAARGQDHHTRYNLLDVLAYTFEISLHDTSDLIQVRSAVEIRFKSAANGFYLDLKQRDSSGKGMVVNKIRWNGKQVPFQHRGDRLELTIQPASPGEVRIYQIDYQGIPRDGLIISENKFGDRTFFGDNWPDRASHWLTVVDHPSDKALVEFIVEAPGHYRIVSNGANICETRNAGRVLSVWKTASTKWCYY